MEDEKLPEPAKTDQELIDEIVEATSELFDLGYAK